MNALRQKAKVKNRDNQTQKIFMTAFDMFIQNKQKYFLFKSFSVQIILQFKWSIETWRQTQANHHLIIGHLIKAQKQVPLFINDFYRGDGTIKRGVLYVRIQLFILLYLQMNYYTFQPNCYSSTLAAPSMMFAPSLTVSQPMVTKIEYISSLLRQALRISVTNYSATFSGTTQANSQSTQISVEENVKKVISAEEVEMVLEQEEKKQNLKLVSDLKKENGLVNNKQTNEKIAASFTDDELPSKQAISLNLSANKKTSKKRRNQENTNFTVIVPEVDLIQTAYVPTIPAQTQQLTLLRNSLLLRQVTEIGDFCKGRRDKRQIRMLAN